MAAPAPSATGDLPTAAAAASHAASIAISAPECPVCTHAFECDEPAETGDSRIPRTLQCAHSLCSACLLQLLEATPGRVTCPSCRDERPIKMPDGVADLSAAAVFLIPQNSDIIQSIKCIKQLQEQQWVQVQQQPSARCMCGADCAAAAMHWCGECDGELCTEHDAALHAGALSTHERIALSEKVAARQAKLGAVLAVAGSKLKSEMRSTVQNLVAAVALKDAELSSHQRALVDLQPLPLLLSPSGIYHCQSRPAGAANLLRSLSDDQFGHLQRFLANGSLVANKCTRP